MRLAQIHAPVLTLAIALLAACPASADEVAVIVEGHVTFKGKPVADGAIVFYLDNDEFVGAKLKDGKYKVTRAPAGRCRVGIVSEDIPAKYGMKETSGLTREIKSGVNTFDFSLTD